MLTAMSCVACGTDIPAAARFCPACGHRVDGRADERRVVTVLFADVVGFTSLSETRDPEQVKGLVDR
jgi:class 3 adenylate cyclase